MPDPPYFTVVTWQRLVILAGLAAVVTAGARLADFRTRLDVPILGLAAAALAVTVRTGGGPEFRHLLSFIAVYYLVVALIRVEKQAWTTLVMLAWGGVTVAGAVALSQFSQDTPTGFCRSRLLRDAPCEPGMLVRATGTFANPNLLAAFVLLVGPLAVLAVATIVDRTYQICVLALAVVGYAGLLVTFSRAAYIAGFAGLLAVAFGVVAAMSQAGRSLGVRGEAWGAAVDIAREHPLGVGLGQAGAQVNARIDGSVEFVHVHNLWLNWLVEAGVLGFLAIAASIVGAVVTAVGLARQNNAVGFAGLAALVGFLTMNLMDHPSNLGRIAIAFWLVLGVVMGSAPVRWRAAPAVRKPAPADRPTEELQRVSSAGRITGVLDPVAMRRRPPGSRVPARPARVSRARPGHR